MKGEIVCKFRVEPFRGEVFEAVAAESSIGTWTRVSTMKPRIAKMRPRIFSMNPREKTIKIAYPLDLFEPGNIPQLLSSVAGNVFGMKMVRNLRLLDIEFPGKYMRGFRGPEIGLNDLRRITRIMGRPLAGTIYKPKMGLNPREMAGLAYRVYSNGIDFTKDDENLGNMGFCRFEDRVVKILDVVDRIKSEQGKNVIYAPNITAPTQEMLRRAEFVREHGGKCIMIDILTVGWSALQTIREQNLGMIIHAHRASHAAVTRNSRHGISMLVFAKLARLIGVTALHSGTVVGKMEGPREEVIEIDNFLRRKWKGLKGVMPVASGGLHPGLIASLVKILGKDMIINCGGGLWGHTQGPEAGARAIRQAIDASIKRIPLKKYAQTHKELKAALNKWPIDLF